MGKIVLMFDLDGTILDTNIQHAILAAEVMHNHFGLSPKEATKRYHETSGIPFPRQLEKIFPNATEGQRKKCAEEYASQKRRIYENARLFGDVIPTLEALHQKGYELILSSAAAPELIDLSLKKFGLTKYFSEVYGESRGLKAQHINALRAERANHTVVFVGDSRYDVSFGKTGQVVTIGRAGKRREGLWRIPALYKAGATVATKDLRILTKLDLEKVAATATKNRRVIRKSPTKNPYPLRRVLGKIRRIKP
ncbi:MAG: HAD hydrolase-like protein [Candidatus ainarchaeum sp.]|nr:HAD hydrolase-like protein [Candidatus ainarchaeum sp.]